MYIHARTHSPIYIYMRIEDISTNIPVAMMKSLLLLAIFLPSVFTLLSCTRFQNTELSVYYPSCPSGFKEIMECEYSGMALKVCLETKAPPITVSPTTTTTKPTTTTITKPTTTTTTTTKPTTTTTTTKPTTTTTTKPTTTTTTTTTTTKPTTTTTTAKPTTTPTTAKPTTTSTTMPTTTTTTMPTTTLPTTGCGIYPAQGFIFGAKVTTKCQPWLGYVEVFGQIRGSIILINDDTVLAIQSKLPIYVKNSKGMIFPATFYFGNKKVESEFTVKNTFVADNGSTEKSTIVVLKLKKNVTISGCVRPICLPTSEDDYQKVGCRAAIYVADKDGNIQLKMGDTRLINDSTCTKDANNTLCAYPFVQTCTGKMENGGMLICPSKTGSRWMLAGLTRDDLGACTPKKWNEAVHYWDFLKLRANLGL